MPDFYLSPASISYLSLFLLTLVITAYLVWRLFSRERLHPSTSDKPLLLAFFTGTVLCLLALFQEIIYQDTIRLMIVYSLNTILGILIIALIYFAYFFPQPNPKHKTERLLALIISIGYTLWELYYAVLRYWLLLRHSEAIYRPPNADAMILVLFAWIIFVFGRGTVQNWQNPASRRFALIFLIPLLLALLNILKTYYHISHSIFHSAMSVGLLATIFLIALNYLNSQPETTSLMVKFSGAILTSVLAVFGLIAWMVTPSYVEQYRPALPDQRSIRFTPNEIGGYDVAEIPFYFEHEMGENLGLSSDTSPPDPHSPNPPGTREVAFDFPFFGKNYSRVFITNNGFLTFGRPVHYWNLENRLSDVPIFFGLGLNFDPLLNREEGGIFFLQESERLIITFDRVRSLFYPERKYTFQMVLYSDGRLDLTHNGLPEGPQYILNDRRDASVWVIGAKPEGPATDETVSLAELPLKGGPQGVLDDQYRAFREYTHDYIQPLAAIILIVSFFFLILLPLALKTTVVRPLQRLLNGVKQFNENKFHEHIPIQHNDEIGFLTQSFNQLSSELDELINKLEARVDARTAELSKAHKTAMEATRAKSDFLAAMSHEIRTPMNAIMGMTEIMQDKDLSEEQKEYLKIIQDSSDNLLRLINEILDLSKVEAGKITLEYVPFDIKELLENTITMMLIEARKKNLSLKYDIDPGAATELVGDPIRLRQILINLISNAVKFTEEGKVCVNVKVVKEEGDKIYLRFSVSDTGIGIPADFMEQIFDLFTQVDSSTTRKHGGTGLGLAISKRLVDLMGGEIGVISEPGSGSEFWFTVMLKKHLPEAAPPPPRIDDKDKKEKEEEEAAEAEAKDFAHILQGRNVLVVEDNPVNRQIVQIQLEKLGLAGIDYAENGEEAVKAAGEKDYSLVLMDCQMPVMDGYTAARKIREAEEKTGRHTPIIALTAHSMAGDRDKALEAGMDDYISKPVKYRVLRDTVLRHIEPH